MSDIEQAAVLLLSVGEAQAANILKHMPPNQVEKIVDIMEGLGHVSQEKINSTVTDFLEASEQETSIGIDSSSYIRNTLQSALGEEKAAAIIDRVSKGQELLGVDNIKWQDPKAIVSLIREEHPQVIAVLLTYIDSEKSAKIIELLPDELSTEVMRRIATISDISPQALKEMDAVLSVMVQNVRSFKTFPEGGAKLAAGIINFISSDKEKELMEKFSDYDESLTEKIQEYIFPFDKLATIDQRSIQTMLRDISNDLLVLALKGVDDDVKETFLSNMSERAADMLKDDLEASGPVQLSKVTGAQKEIVTIAQRLAKDGKITIGGQGEEMVG